MATLNTEQKINVVVKPLTISGKPTRVDGVPGWAVTNPSVVSLVIAPNGLSADVIAVASGSANVIVSADANLGSGIREISGSLAIVVVQAEAASLSLVAGTPVNA